MSSGEIIRVIDANLNRIGEGLRVLEDIARLMLDDVVLTEKLKKMRHSLLEGDLELNQQLLQFRDSESDVGVNLEKVSPRELPLVAVANARRVQESLRVIEELIKMPDIMQQVKSGKFKKARFSLYSIERALVSRLLRRDKAGRISGAYFVLNTADAGEKDLIEVAKRAVKAGVGVVHFSGSGLSKPEFLSAAQQLKRLCGESNVLFIIEGEVDVALAADADGLFLERDGLPLEVARKLLPIDKVLGARGNTVEEAVSARSEGADYLISGPAEPKTFGEIKRAVDLPLVANETIKSDNIGSIFAGGADAIAVDSQGFTRSTEHLIRQIATQSEDR